MIITLKEQDITEIIADRYNISKDKIEFQKQDNEVSIILSDLTAVNKREGRTIGF